MLKKRGKGTHQGTWVQAVPMEKGPEHPDGEPAGGWKMNRRVLPGPGGSEHVSISLETLPGKRSALGTGGIGWYTQACPSSLVLTTLLPRTGWEIKIVLLINDFKSHVNRDSVLHRGGVSFTESESHSFFILATLFLKALLSTLLLCPLSQLLTFFLCSPIPSHTATCTASTQAYTHTTFKAHNKLPDLCKRLS